MTDSDYYIRRDLVRKQLLERLQEKAKYYPMPNFNEDELNRLREAPKVKTKTTGGGIELASKMSDQMKGLEAFTKGFEGKVPSRHLSFDEAEDPFHLLAVADAYEVAVSEIFNACEVAFCMRISADRKYQKQVKETGQFSMTQRKNQSYSFTLTRIANGDNVLFSFGRTGDTMNETGFEIVKNSSGSVILKSRGETSVDNDETYFDLIYRAKNAIDDFLAANGFIASQLVDQTPPKIPTYHAVAVPEKVKQAGKKGKVAGFNFFHPEKVERDRYGEVIRTGPRSFSRNRVLAIPVLVFSLVGTQMIADNFVFNNSERIREVFDHGTHSLPNAPTITIDGKQHSFELASVSQDISEYTPRIELSSDVQNLKGIRSVVSGDAGAEINIGEDDCDSTFVDLGGKQGIKAITDSEKVAENLKVSLTKVGDDTKLEICSSGDYGSTENHVWLEAA